MNPLVFISKNKSNILLFLLCAGIVSFIQFITLQTVIEYGLLGVQDWWYLLIYKSLDPNPFSQLINSWINLGLHEAPAIYYTGILSDFFGFNYQAYQIANVLFKTIATISLFPVILLFFRNRLLAFITAIIFGINSATAGALQVIDTGAQYLALASLNIFLILYYYAIFKKNIFYLLSSLFFLLTFILYPPRMFPLLLLVPLVEIYWLLTIRKVKNIKFSIVRILIFMVPIILISLPAPVAPGFSFTGKPLILMQEILKGNWHNLLDPFAGIGWMLLTNDFWKFFGKLEADTFKSFGSYLNFLSLGPLLIFGGVSAILSLILSKKPIKFFLLTFGINLLAGILMFFIANDNYRIFETILRTDELGQFIIIRDPNIAALDAPSHFMFTKYPTILGIYILIVAFAAFWEWRKDRENKLLQAIWAGPIFAVIFHFPGWMLQGFLINDISSFHRYYLVPAVGISLFLAAILSLIYQKFARYRSLKGLALMSITVIIFIFLKVNQSVIEREFSGLNSERIKPADQQKLHEKFLDKFGNSLGSGDVLFYFEIEKDRVNLRRTPKYYKEALILSDIGYWIKLRKKELTYSCTGTFTDFESLKAATRIINGQINFIFPGQCDYKDGEIWIRRIFDTHLYKLENLRAYKIENGDFIDIREEVLSLLNNYYF